MSRYVSTSAPPSWTSGGTSSASATAISAFTQSPIEMGWVLVSTQRGAIMAGRWLTSPRTISKLALPGPTIIAARACTSGGPCSSSVFAVSAREARCADWPSRPPR